MKVNVNSLSKISHPEKYTNVLDSLTKSREQLEEHIKKYSDKQDYDKILKLYDENKELVEHFRTFINNKELLMSDILEVVKKHNESFIKNSNIKYLAKRLQIEGSFLGEERVQSQMKNITDIYVKAQENSNLIIIYDIEKKKFHHIKIPERNFYAKSYSFYDKNTKIVYVSGGMSGFLKDKNYINEFLQFKVKLVLDEYQFEFSQLCSMGMSRAGHSMIQYNEFLIVAGGVNTKKCEIYDKNSNSWKDLTELPSLCFNPALAILNKHLFCFSGSGNLNTFDSIFMLSLNNLSRIVSGDKGFENILIWEKINYYFDFESSGRLRRGMAALTVGSHEILLFGGFNYDNIYDTVFDFDLFREKEKKTLRARKESMQSDIEDNLVSGSSSKQIQIQQNQNEHSVKQEEYMNLEDEDCGVKINDTDLILPVKTFFNSNIVTFDNYLVMIDGYNNAIEFDLKTREFYYYT